MMKEFIYKAYDESGVLVEDRLQAESRIEAAREVFARDLHLIHLEEKKEEKALLSFRQPFSSRRKLSLLAEEWAALLDAGLTMTDSLALLEEQMGAKERKVLGEIGKTIATGHGIGDSFRRVRCFPPFFISLLQVGELSGTLPEELHRISKYYEKEDRFIRQLERALAYPLFTTLFSLVLFFVILTFILPSFALLFEALSIPLPKMASLALSLGLWLRDYGFFLFSILLFLVLGGILFCMTEEGKKRVDHFLYHRTFYRRILLIRFCTTLSALLESGRTLSESLRDVREVLHNRAAASALSKVIRQLEAGKPFDRAMGERGFAFPLVCHLCRVGMESGELPRFLQHGGDILSQETERKLHRFRAVLEPSLLLFTGAVTAFLVFSVMLPVFQAAGSHMGG